MSPRPALPADRPALPADRWFDNHRKLRSLRFGAGSMTDLMVGHARPRRGVQRPAARWAGPRHAWLHDASSVRAWSDDFAYPGEAGHGLSHPHYAERLTTPAALPRLPIVRPSCASDAASSVLSG